MPFIPDSAPTAPPKGRFVPDAPATEPPAAPPKEPGFWDAVTAPGSLTRNFLGNIKSTVQGLGHEALGAGELGLMGLSAAGAGVKGVTEGLGTKVGELVTRLRGDALPAEEFNPVNVAADTINRDTYQPRSEAGQTLGADIGGALETSGKGYGEIAKLAGAPESVVTGLEDYIPVAENLGLALGGGPKVGAAVESTLTRPGPVRPAVADVNAPVQTARAAGYDLRPSDIKAANPSESVPGTFRERFQNAEELKKGTTQKNQITTTREAGADLGLGDTKRIGDNELNAAKAPHFKAYEAADAALRQIPPSAEFSALVTRGAQEARLPGTPSTTKVLGALRRKSAKNIASDDVKTQEAGYATRELADQIEAGFGQQLEAMGDKKLFDQYQISRQALAKIHDVESSLRGGQVDAGKLAQIQRKYPGRLTGRLKLIADTAENFPNVTGSSLKTAAGAGAGEVPASKTGIITSAAKAIVRNLPGMDVRSARFQNKFGTEATPAQQSYFGQYGARPEEVAPPAAAVAPSLPQQTVIPSRAQTLAGDLGLAPDYVANPEVLPEAPSRLTADQIPAARGGLPFRGTPDTSLAGDLGLVPEAAPAEGLPFTTAPETGLAEGLGLAPPRLREQGKLKVEAPQRPELSLTAPPGPKSAPPVQHAVTKGGQHTFRVEDGGELIAKDLPDEGRLQIVESKVPEGKRGEGRGTALYKAALKKAESLGRKLVSDIRVSEPAQKVWDSLEKSGVKVKRNPAKKTASGELISKSELKPVFEVVTE